jgi:hypothetical protein
VIVALQGCVIIALQGCVIVAYQGSVIVALQGCVIFVLQGCVIGQLAPPSGLPSNWTDCCVARLRDCCVKGCVVSQLTVTTADGIQKVVGKFY